MTSFILSIREIMIQVAHGCLSKQIAGDIGIAEATVKVHRSRLMHKMKARSLPELSRMAFMETGRVTDMGYAVAGKFAQRLKAHESKRNETFVDQTR
jgi:DNA-binding CsgD family transcriptional regulator